MAEAVTVTVKLFADLRRFLPKGHDGPLTLTFPEGATVADVIEHIGIPSGEEITVGVGDELGRRETPLHEGLVVLLFTPMQGGAA